MVVSDACEFDLCMITHRGGTARDRTVWLEEVLGARVRLEMEVFNKTGELMVKIYEVLFYCQENLIPV